MEYILNRIIKEEKVFCLECGQEHSVKLYQGKTACIIRDEKIEYEESYYVCEEAKERFETIELISLNLLAARDAYRKIHNLLQSKEIKNIRDKFKITQEEFSILLGFGAKTIARYETKQIQDVSNDCLMRLFDEDYNFALNQLKKQKDSLQQNRYEELYAIITGYIQMTTNEVLEETALKNDYIWLEKEKEYNGDSSLNIDKLKNMMIYFANNTENLTKVKQMKLLWYFDAVAYITKKKSMTGLVYQHKPFGALPIGWDKIVDLNCVDKYEYLYDEHLCTQFLPKKYVCVDDGVFDSSEMDILKTVCGKFKEIGARDISDIMHNEDVYLNSEDGEFLNFRSIKKLKVKF